MTIGKAIRELRKERKMSQARLAQEIFMSVNAVSAIERDRSYPPKTTVERICRVLEVPTAFFLLASIDEGDFPENKRMLYKAVLEPLKKELINNET